MIYLVITAVICLTDLTVKYLVESRLKLDVPREHPAKVLKIKRMHNRGIALNGFDRFPHAVALVTGILTALVSGLYGFLLHRKESALTCLGFSMLTGGALSNAYDRIKRGFVVDYVAFRTKWKRFSRIYFNIADFFIMAGCAVIVLASYLKRR